MMPGDPLTYEILDVKDLFLFFSLVSGTMAPADINPLEIVLTDTISL